MNNNKKYFKMYIFVFFTIYAFLLLLFCSGASPLIKEIFGDNGYYIYNGRWIQSGNLPYVNFPDTVCKGIYMWFVNYIGTIITPQSFLGNYIIESIFKSIDLCLAYCIFNVYCETFLSTNRKKGRLIPWYASVHFQPYKSGCRSNGGKRHFID